MGPRSPPTVAAGPPPQAQGGGRGVERRGGRVMVVAVVAVVADGGGLWSSRSRGGSRGGGDDNVARRVPGWPAVIHRPSGARALPWRPPSTSPSPVIDSRHTRRLKKVDKSHVICAGGGASGGRRRRWGPRPRGRGGGHRPLRGLWRIRGAAVDVAADSYAPLRVGRWQDFYQKSRHGLGGGLPEGVQGG